MPLGGLTLFRVSGIRISVDWSWFLVLFLIIFTLSDSFRQVTDAEDGSTGPYLLALVAAVLFFGSILLHELGHAFEARRHGIGTSGITLWMFGGVANLERDSDSPGTEFKVAIAGPLVTALILAVCLGAGALIEGWDRFLDAASFESGAGISGTTAVIAWLATINFLVLGFNLIPAFPLDGGRIARAIAWKLTSDRTKGTRFAATLGRGFAYLLMGFGAFLLFRGDPVSGVWFIFIGFIINSSARGAVAQSEVTGRIEGLSVGDVMDRQPVAIPERTDVSSALDEFFLRYGYPWFPVIDGESRFVGLIDRGAAERVDPAERAATTVASILAHDSGSLTVRDNAPLETVLGNTGLRRLGALMAVDGQGRLSGVVTVEQVSRALQV